MTRGVEEGEDDRVKPILVIRDERTQCTAASFVDAKGATPYAVKFVSGFIRYLGYRKVVLKSDGEHAIVALKESAAREAAIEMVFEESLVGAHQANGLVDNAFRAVKRHARVLRSAVEERLAEPCRMKILC